MDEKEIKLGDEVWDMLTRTRGFVTAKATNLFGGPSALVEYVANGRIVQQWVDERRLEKRPKIEKGE